MKRKDCDFSTTGTLEELQNQITDLESFIDEIETRSKNIKEKMEVTTYQRFTDIADISSFIENISIAFNDLDSLCDDLY